MYKELIFSNVEQFLKILKDNALLSGWLLAFEDFTGNTKKLYLKNNAGDCFVFFEYIKNENISDNRQVIKVNVASEFNPNKTIYNQNNSVSTDYSFMIYENLTTKLFLNINNNRIFLVNRQSNYYLPLYIGKYLAYASPLQNQNPFIILGGCGRNSGKIDGTMYNNYYNLEEMNVFFNDSIVEKRDIIMFPYYNNISYSNNLQNVSNNFDNLNDYTVFDIEIFSNQYNNKGAVGTLDSIYAISNNNLSSEFNFTLDSNEHIVFGNPSKNEFYFTMKKA